LKHFPQHKKIPAPIAARVEPPVVAAVETPKRRGPKRIVESCEHCGSQDVFVTHTRVLYRETPDDPNSSLLPVVALRYRPSRNHPQVVERYWKCNACCKTGKMVERVVID